VNPSPALIVHFPPGTSAAGRDRLVALLADHHLTAIQEDDAVAPRTWTAHFATAAARDAAATAVRTLPELGGMQLESAEVEDDDWARRTQADLPAIKIGRVIVAPPWDCATAERGDIVVEIEPSRGFGTGHHESTRLCIVLLQSRDLAGKTIIDVGTGSGVLAITAARLGAAFVSAIDVDVDAIENARENIERNGVSGVVEAHVRDMVDSTTPPADVVTANLTGTLLARHARELMRLVRPFGSLIVAGFTEDERDMVTEAFLPGFHVSELAEEAGWCAFVLATPPRQR
jgi:ribosomal protein L11 methyltransferase